MALPRARAALAVLPLTLGLAACSGGADATDGASGAIAVTASDTACEVERSQAEAGTVEFAVTNSGSKVNEFYVYAEGDRIMGEVENVGPGLTRTFHVELARPGAYETACKPGMVGDGIRAAFTVTGESVAPGTDDENLRNAVAEYERYVESQADAFLERTT
jgi:iron uptake system component EfeO